ncbi:MAG: hypothetical protein JO119_09470 [Acidobacteria bacterium]|nr:hypothetical protein [Acidobacteriota bacterium]
MRLKLLVFACLTLAVASRGGAQIQFPPETKNAALRYWTAFAEMQDLSTDKATQDLLEKTVSGEAVWDEKKIAPILDANKFAIDIMQRATKLRDCDWGVEYEQGTNASIAYAPRARALSRLNTLEGMRQLAAGNTQSATNSWLAGVRFSQDLARGGSLIFALMAKNALLANLRTLNLAAANGQLSVAERQQVAAGIHALPEDAFDWSAAWGLESAALDQFLRKLQSASDPGALYQQGMGSPAPEKGIPPSAQDIRNFETYMRAVQSALKQSPEKAKTSLESLDSQRSGLTEAEQRLIPNAQKANQARIDIAKARTDLLRALNKSAVKTGD